MVNTVLLKLQYNRQLWFENQVETLGGSVVVALVPLIEVEKKRQLNKHLYQVHCKFH